MRQRHTCTYLFAAVRLWLWPLSGRQPLPVFCRLCRSTLRAERIYSRWANLGAILTSQPLLAQLRAIVGESGISTEPDDLSHWGRDWTRAIAPAPFAIVWPQTADQVVELVGACRAFGCPIVPSGGRTGLAAGAVASANEVVLSLDRLRALGSIDPLNRSVTVGAGVPNQVLQEHCAPHGLWWPVDLASKGSATVGGNLSTNAGGVKVLRYGHARNWMLGLQVVTSTGELLQLGGALHKDNSGYALSQLIVGSEGTLAIITAATLALAPLPRDSEVALVACRNLPAVLDLYARLREQPIIFNAFEFFTAACMNQVLSHTGLSRPLPHSEAYALIDLENPGQMDVARWLSEATDVVIDAVVATDANAARKLWQYRERISESLQPLRPHKNDVAVAISQLAQLADRVSAWLRHNRPQWDVALFGHVGDGNLHVNTLAPADLTGAQWQLACAEADAELYAIVGSFGGSLSAEHGVGLSKKAYLSVTRSPAEVAMMRTIKAALDPRNMLNPGKIFDV